MRGTGAVRYQYLHNRLSARHTNPDISEGQRHPPPFKRDETPGSGDLEGQRYREDSGAHCGGGKHEVSPVQTVGATPRVSDAISCARRSAPAREEDGAGRGEAANIIARSSAGGERLAEAADRATGRKNTDQRIVEASEEMLASFPFVAQI